MSDRWAASLPHASASHLGPLRLIDGLEVCQQAALIWIRGDDLESLDAKLRCVPDVHRFYCLDDGQLIPVDHKVPTSVLPDGTWTPLANWLVCQLPPTVWTGSAPARVPLRLVRASTPTEPTLLLLSMHAWHAYVDTAPQVRLDRLSFALDSGDRVLVRGRPLPPLDGKRFVEFDGIGVPVGWHWEPAVDPAAVRSLFSGDQLSPGSPLPLEYLVLLTVADGVWEQIPLSAFVRASRSAVRLTQEAANERP